MQDLFQIMPETEDFKPQVEAPASYEKDKPLELHRPATIEDIADFVVDLYVIQPIRVSHTY
jgi:hypothetical protein